MAENKILTIQEFKDMVVEIITDNTSAFDYMEVEESAAEICKLYELQIEILNDKLKHQQP
jgi:hypothetical protein